MSIFAYFHPTISKRNFSLLSIQFLSSQVLTFYFPHMKRFDSEFGYHFQVYVTFTARNPATKRFKFFRMSGFPPIRRLLNMVSLMNIAVRINTRSFFKERRYFKLINVEEEDGTN